MELHYMESLFCPSPRLVRAWQLTGLVLLCFSQQGCMCGCFNHQTVAKTATLSISKAIASGFGSRPARDGELAAKTKDWYSWERNL